MNNNCEHYRAQILAGSATEHEALRCHLADCPACRELCDLDEALAATLASDAHRLDAHPSLALPEALRAQTLTRAQSALHQTPRPVQTASPTLEKPFWRDVLANLFSGSPRLAGALAALLLIVALGALIHGGQQRPLAAVDFVRGVATVQGEATSRPAQSMTLAPGQTLATGSGGECLLTLGDGRARIAVAQASRLTILSRDRLRLEDGEIWLSVRPEGRGLEVITDQGAVRVTGTVYGVAADQERLRVEVIEGSVSVSLGAGPSIDLEAGETIDSSSPGRVLARPAGLALPDWVADLGRAEDIDEDMHYLPSLRGD